MASKDLRHSVVGRQTSDVSEAAFTKPRRHVVDECCAYASVLVVSVHSYVIDVSHLAVIVDVVCPRIADQNAIDLGTDGPTVKSTESRRVTARFIEVPTSPRQSPDA